MVKKIGNSLIFVGITVNAAFVCAALSPLRETLDRLSGPMIFRLQMIQVFFALIATVGFTVNVTIPERHSKGWPKPNKCMDPDAR